MRQRRRHPRSCPVLIHLRVILLPPGNRQLQSPRDVGTQGDGLQLGAAEIGEQPNPSVSPFRRRRRVSHMPCHCSLTCRAGEWAPAMSMSLSRSRSALQCKRRARSISALRRAARLLRRPLRTCFLASGAGAGGTGVGGGNACCLGGGMCNERRGPRNHDSKRSRNDGEEAELQYLPLISSTFSARLEKVEEI